VDRTDDVSLQAAATRWIAGDPDPATQATLQAALAGHDMVELRAAMERPIQFGTAGLRAAVGPGAARMNRAVVLRTTWALVAHLRATADPDLPVCVGFDARPDSARFAADVVNVLTAAGRRVIGWDTPTPTPLVAWAARETGAAAAVVITASHNPPADNGYKLYAGDAIQIVSPTDSTMAALIESAPPATEVERSSEGWEHALVEGLGPYARRRYLDQVVELIDHPGDRGDVRVVHTSLHGVGGTIMVEAFARAGTDDVRVVPEQHDPDGSFPTVPFPNPEEPGALDLAFDLARRTSADLVIANDPDTDRLAVAVEDVEGWRRLSGNEVAVLLADDLLRRAPDRSLVTTSVVTSPWVAAVAVRHGARAEQTLTGFKWIWHAAHRLAADGWTPVLGAEEALGYSVGSMVRDKDGIAAAVVFVDLARRLAAQGETVLDRLAELRAQDGSWVAAQVSVVRDGPDGPAEIADAMARARTAPPSSLMGHTVRAVVDYSVDVDSRPPWLGETDLIELQLDNGRVLIRPSGTEPKCKAYVDLRALPGSDPAVVRAEAVALGRSMLAHVGLH
jgi:phosphomannomutase